MSTLTSTDLHLKRSSTRVHAPPGGGSQWSIGNVDTPQAASPARATGRRAAPAPTSPVAASPAPAAATESVDTAATAEDGTTIGVVASMTGPDGADTLLASCLKQLEDSGVTTIVDKVGAPFELPFAVGRLASKHDNLSAVVALGVLVKANDILFDQKASVVAQGLMQVSLSCGLPVVNGLVATQSPVDTSVAAKRFANGVVCLASGGRSSATSAPLLPPTPPASASASASSSAGASRAAAGASEPVKAVTEQLAAAKIDEAAAAEGTKKLLDALRTSLKQHGARGIVGLGRKFRIIDDDNSKSIDVQEFQKVIAEHSLGFADQDVAALFALFDEDGSGQISYDEFLVCLRGELNERRTQLVLQAFTVIDADGNGVLELGDVMGKYKADKHPAVISGERTASQVLREFLDTFDGGEKDGKVYPTEFLRYYSNVSASIDDDDYFELMIRNAWHISGGEGWCANTSCRRVLVTHADGSQSVEEVKDDIGIGADDKQAIKANLAAQGVNAGEIATSGSVDSTDKNGVKRRTPGRGRQRGGGTSSVVFG